MTVSQAVGLCPSLAVWEPDPVYYDEQFSHLVKVLCDVSPSIEPTELGRVFVGVDGLDGLYGDPKKQVDVVRTALGTEAQSGRFAREAGEEGIATTRVRDGKVATTWDGWGRVARLGWAKGKFAAWVAANKAQPGKAFVVTDGMRPEFLASQPVGVLTMSSDTHRRLIQLSINTVGELARLPEVAAISQFGTEGRHLWQLATGAVVDPVVGREAPEPIVSEIDFPNSVADSIILNNALDRLIERALRHPRRAGWRVLETAVRARLEHSASWTIRNTLKDPSADRDQIARPLKARLGCTPPAGAVINLAVEFLQFVRGTDELQLFARDSSSSARAGRRRALRTAVHEVKTRFARSFLYRVVEVHPGSRIPERRYALIDYDP